MCECVLSVCECVEGETPSLTQPDISTCGEAFPSMFVY